MRALYRRQVARKDWVGGQLARELCEVSQLTGRRVGLLIDRQGQIEKVVVGDAHRVFLPDLGPRRAGAARFRGVRLVLSNLRPGGLTDEDLTDLALLQLDAVINVSVNPDGLPGTVTSATLLPPNEGAKVHRVETIANVWQWPEDFQVAIADLEGQFTRSPQLARVEGMERVILVGVTLGNTKQAHRSLDELHRLAETAGLQVIDKVLQVRHEIDGRTYVGKGKLQELLLQSMHLGGDALIFDHELSPSQLRNIAETTELKVLDRTQLILDIFAQHAHSREGKLQVELAQLRYRAPRLKIMPTSMSRLTGGIGGRGPGETKLEINRRRADERATRLERDLEEIAGQRAVRRRRRQRAGLPVCSIVGYTNAGKSTLLNRLTESHVVALDKLFATLDPTSRRLRFPEEREIIVTDTVGFIQELPATLIAAFKATLEELEGADLLIHVLDAADEEVERQRVAVDGILAELSLADVPTVLVWNKADNADALVVERLVREHGGLALSALTGEGCAALLVEMERMLFRQQRRQNAEPPLELT